jgi:DNA-binding GntR family transcriptional regulator
MRPIDTTTTVEELVFREIRQAILAGALAAGERLRLRELAAELNVSVLPVRNALARLRAEGLVRHAARSGSIVAPIEFEDFEELQARRLGVESLAARLGAERMNAESLARMEKELQLVSRLAAEQDLQRFLAAEAGFRQCCFERSDRDRLVAEVRDYRLRAERYLRIAFSSPRGLERSVEFQRRLLNACTSRDGRAAERDTRRAIEWTKEIVRASLAAVARTA